MKNTILVFLLLTLLPSVAFGNGAAPYTEEALQKINTAIAETPKEEFGPEASREEVHRGNMEYFNGVFAKAGYDFSATIDKIVDDMKNNPQDIPADRETVYNKIFVLLHILMHECDADKINCLEFYPATTGESIRWFRENSGFSLQDHHKANK